MSCREDDTNWPKKNIVGKQELEIRLGTDHIAFEVSKECLNISIDQTDMYNRRQKSGRWSMYRTVKIQMAYEFSTI